jgi:hypothetical protein
MFLGYSQEHTKDTLRFMNVNTNRVIYSRDYLWLNTTWGKYNNITEAEVTYASSEDEFVDDWENLSVSSGGMTDPDNHHKFQVSDDSSSESSHDGLSYHGFHLVSDVESTQDDQEQEDINFDEFYEDGEQPLFNDGDEDDEISVFLHPPIQQYRIKGGRSDHNNHRHKQHGKQMQTRSQVNNGMNTRSKLKKGKTNFNNQQTTWDRSTTKIPLPKAKFSDTQRKMT